MSGARVRVRVVLVLCTGNGVSRVRVRVRVTSSLWYREWCERGLKRAMSPRMARRVSGARRVASSWGRSLHACIYVLDM